MGCCAPVADSNILWLLNYVLSMKHYYNDVGVYVRN